MRSLPLCVCSLLMLLGIVGCGNAPLVVGGAPDGGADLSVARDAGMPRDLTVGGSDLVSAPWDLLHVVCASNCSSCPSGMCCNGICCGVGEWCDGYLKCHCGQGPACGAANPICASGGPVSGGQCGSICCGGTSPCPL